jgi:hypothetical protein
MSLSVDKRKLDGLVEDVLILILVESDVPGVLALGRVSLALIRSPFFQSSWT